MTTNDKDDRRHFHRILFDAPAYITFAGNQFETQLIDISLNGALLGCPTEFSGGPGDLVMLDIQLGNEVSINLEAQVTHREEHQLGLHCIHIDMESISHLRRLLELNLGNSELLERDLSALG